MVELVSGTQYFRPSAAMRKGDVVVGHEHNFHHNTIVIQGGIHIRADLPDGSHQERRVYARGFTLEPGATPYPWIGIAAGIRHTITALEDDTFFLCTYSHNTAQGHGVAAVCTGWEGAYI